MTTATFYRNGDGQVIRFFIAGHAGFADHGEDIVCASISMLSLSIINGIEEVVGQKLNHSIDEINGTLLCSVPEGIEQNVMKMTQILMETLVLNMKELSRSYPDYVEVFEEEV